MRMIIRCKKRTLSVRKQREIESGLGVKLLRKGEKNCTMWRATTQQHD